MSDVSLEVGSIVAFHKPQFTALTQSLQKMGYETIGPIIMDECVVYEPIDGLSDLPHGYLSEQDGGRYRLHFTGHNRYFDITPGAQSWKGYLFPPSTVMFSIKHDGIHWEIKEAQEDTLPKAFIGVRACELAAIQIQDRVFLREEWSDPGYRIRRHNAFIISVDCLHPGDTCFCASMGTGPKNTIGFDLNLTELDDVFLAEIGSEAGRMLIAKIDTQPASAFLVQAAQRGIEEARRRMGRALPNPDELKTVLLENLEHPRWEQVSQRCLSCTNCTQVCPTCFCWDVHEKPDLTATTTQRVRVWDSCFSPDYSYIAGGNTRPTTMSRYRQWLTHKLASWHYQFDTSGCVGCGRCITWCPAGIDLTEEVAAIRKETVP